MTQKSSGSKPKLRRAKSLLATKEPAKKKKATKTATSRTKTATTAKTKTTATRTRKKASDAIDQKIAEKAFELYQRRGNFHGLDQYDWELADQIVQLETSRSKLKTKKRTKFDPNSAKNRTRIAQKAYELYLLKGCINGTNDYDWYVAEQLVRLDS